MSTLELQEIEKIFAEMGLGTEEKRAQFRALAQPDYNELEPSSTIGEKQVGTYTTSHTSLEALEEYAELA